LECKCKNFFNYQTSKTEKFSNFFSKASFIGRKPIQSFLVSF
jgi:hypothetical protein